MNVLIKLFKKVPLWLIQLQIIIAIAFTIYASLVALENSNRTYISKYYLPVEATVTKITISYQTKGAYFFPYITYFYEINGKRYDNITSLYSVKDTDFEFWSEEEATEFLNSKNIYEGSRTTFYYDPKKPNKSAIFKTDVEENAQIENIQMLATVYFYLVLSLFLIAGWQGFISLIKGPSEDKVTMRKAAQKKRFGKKPD